MKKALFAAGFLFCLMHATEARATMSRVAEVHSVTIDNNSLEAIVIIENGRGEVETIKTTDTDLQKLLLRIANGEFKNKTTLLFLFFNKETRVVYRYMMEDSVPSGVQFLPPRPLY